MGGTPYGSPAAPDLKPFGWAGWLLAVPGDWRPLRIDGNAERGSVDLGDATEPRAQFAWSTVTRRHFAAGRTLRRVLKRVAPKTIISTASEATLEPLLYCTDGSGRCCFAGYAPLTHRVIQGFLNVPSGSWGGSETAGMLAELADQQLEMAQKWSFFNISFITPPRFRYRDASLTLGDMRVSLESVDRKPVAELHVRHVYPAALALSRGNLETWLAREWTRDANDRRIKVPEALSGTTPLGRSATCTSDRPIRRWILRKTPHTIQQRCTAVHDEQHERLLIVRVKDHAEQARTIMQDVIKGMHWSQATKAGARLQPSSS